MPVQFTPLEKIGRSTIPYLVNDNRSIEFIPIVEMMHSNGVNHITSRGNEKKAVFKDDRDRINILNTLRHVKNSIIGSVMPAV